jgi:hypothetical protein
MRAGARHIRHLVRTRGAGLALIALAATCSLPAAAQASELPSVQPTAAGVTAQLGQTATPAGAVPLDTTAPAQAAVQQTAAEVLAPTQPVVERAAQTLTKASTSARPVVDTAVRSVETAAAPPRPAAPARPAAPSPRNPGDGVRALSRAPSGPSGQKAAPQRNDSARTAGNSERVPWAGAERVTASMPAADSTTATPASVGDATSATHELPAGAGSAASASSTSFSIGAFALLAAALMLAAPALARRIRVDGAFFRPVLFVSVLERPG